MNWNYISYLFLVIQTLDLRFIFSLIVFCVFIFPSDLIQVRLQEKLHAEAEIDLSFHAPGSIYYS